MIKTCSKIIKEFSNYQFQDLNTKSSIKLIYLLLVCLGPVQV